ncbi:MAG: hypothetical protein HC921_09105 [Synechococcaceae cyanobacterium SM2_3_1]|nr:hypothetical protein [Synechococcaceae cyanobacterium SM2_3_1]
MTSSSSSNCHLSPCVMAEIKEQLSSYPLISEAEVLRLIQEAADQLPPSYISLSCEVNGTKDERASLPRPLRRQLKRVVGQVLKQNRARGDLKFQPSDLNTPEYYYG